MIKLVQLCDEFPESYDAFDGSKQVGYLKTRWSTFTVECPDSGGKIVYSVNTKGFERFDDNERNYYLRFAVDAIQRWQKGEFDVLKPAPDVDYEVVPLTID